MRRSGRCGTAGLRPEGQAAEGQKHSAQGPQVPQAFQKGIHVDFLKQTNTASARIQNEQTHLWREVQKMGGLIRGGAVRTTGAKVVPTG